MNILDRTIAWFSPSTGLRRAHHRAVLERSYAGAKPSRTTDEKPKNQSGDQELRGRAGADEMRAWARLMVRDNCYAWNVVDTIVSNTVGDGIRALSVFETPEGEDVEDVNDLRDKEWSDWCELADINGTMTFEEIQVLAVREMVEAGEVLIRMKTVKEQEDGIYRRVPLALEMIEADRLATEKDTYTAKPSGGNRIFRGIEFNKQGRPIAYWIYKAHPNEAFVVDREPERVPAAEIIHLYRKDRISMTRGISWFSPVMKPSRDLGVYVDNEIQTSAVTSCFGAFITTTGDAGDLANPDGSENTDEAGNRLTYLEPGIVNYLQPGESVNVVNPARPNSGAEPWINLMLRGMAAGTGVSYEALSKDFSKTSYSSSRTSKLEDRPRCKRWTKYVVHHLCQRTWDKFCDIAAIAKVKGFPSSSDLLDDRRKHSAVEWQLPEQPWVDPQSEQAASSDAIEKYMDTYQGVLGARGLSARAVFYQRAKEERLKRRLGLLSNDQQQQQADLAAVRLQTNAQEATAEPAAPQPSGMMASLSTMQHNRNEKAMNKILYGLIRGDNSEVKARVLLSNLGFTQPDIDALIADALDTSTAEEPEVANAA